MAACHLDALSQDEGIELDADVYRIIRANQHLGKKRIFSILMEDLKVTREVLAESLLRLYNRISD